MTGSHRGRISSQDTESSERMVQISSEEQNVEVSVAKEKETPEILAERNLRTRSLINRENRVFYIILGVLVLAAIGVTLYYLLPHGSIPFLDENDGFNGIRLEDAPRWNTRNAGSLSLRVLNALEPQWEASFVQSIDEWENGTPDVLTMTVSRVNIDNACEPVTARLKVCNGDYGQTNWYGLNALLLFNGVITASTAKLNDFLLHDASDARRHYTMCHEIGHGFGLPHTDENFLNRNQGNCMDYTQFPRTNQQPGQVNFDFLYQMYGPQEMTSRNNNNNNRGLLRHRRAQDESIETVVVDESMEDASDEDSDEGDEATTVALPDYIKTQYLDAVTEVEQEVAESKYERTTMATTTDPEAVSFYIDFGHGYAMHIQSLRKRDGDDP